MMTATIKEEQNRSKGLVISLIFHALLVLTMLLYTFDKKPEPPQVAAIQLEWGGGGDNAAAGMPDEGQGDDPAPQGQQMEDPSETQPVEDPAPTPTPPSTPPPAASKPSQTQTPVNTPTTTDPNAAAIKKAQEDAKRKQDETNRQRQAQEEANRVAEAERQRQAQAAADQKKREQAERDKKKGQFGGTFGQSGASGSGQGNTGKPGNQGTPGGTGDNPFGKSSGDGGGTGGGSGTGTGVSIGGGLAGRKVVSRPRIVDTSQKVGKIVIEICVDASGNVVQADYTQRGSTTTDAELRNKALSAAKQYKFAASGGGGSECGPVTFTFRVQ